MISSNPEIDGFEIQNVLVTVVDDDKPAIVINETGNGTTVFEGNVPGQATGGVSDSYTVELSKPPVAGEIVTVTLQLGNQLTADRTEIRFGATEDLGRRRRSDLRLEQRADGDPDVAWRQRCREPHQFAGDAHADVQHGDRRNLFRVSKTATKRKSWST